MLVMVSQVLVGSGRCTWYFDNDVVRGPLYGSMKGGRMFEAKPHGNRSSKLEPCAQRCPFILFLRSTVWCRVMAELEEQQQTDTVSPHPRHQRRTGSQSPHYRRLG